MAEPNDVPPRWREGAPPRSPEERSRRSRRRWALGLALVAAAIILGVVAVLAWLHPPPHAEGRMLWVAPPPDLYGPAWEAHDREALAHNPLFARDAESPPSGLDREALARRLADLPNGGRSDVLALFLSGYAEVRGGEVQLLPAGAPGEPTPLRDVLRALASSPARHKLLILDVASPPPDPRRGLLGDDIGAAVPADLDAVPDPARLTLVSVGAGQTPADVDDIQRSVFGYYLDRGIRGMADGAVDGVRDGVVTARELAAYVRSRVERWMSRTRSGRQTPELYGPAGDFALVAAGPDAAPAAPAATPTAYPDWLRDAWKTRQSLWDSGDYRAAPASFHLTEKLLLDAERDWFDGADGGAGADNVKRELARLEKRRVPPPAPDAPSLGAQATQGRRPDAKAVEAVRAAIQPERLAPAPTQPAPPTGATPAVPAVPAETLAALKDKSAFDVASAVWDAATEEADPRPERLRALDAVLRAVQPEPQFAETALLRRLAELASRPGAWPAQAVRRALEAAQAGEQLSGDPEAVHVRRLLAAGDGRRYEGETLLLACRGYASPEEADRELQATAEDYDVCRRSLDAVRRARQTLDRARALLPSYIPYLEWEGAPEKDWTAAAAAARDLADRLDAPEPADAAGALRRNDELARAADDLESYLDRLMLPFQAARLAELRERLRRPYARPAVLAEAEAVLATPLPPPDERGPVWEATRALGHRLYEEAARTDQADDAHHAAGQPPASSSTESSRANSLILRRARVSLALLRLGGAPGIDSIQQSLAHAEEAAGEAEKFGPAAEALADELRRAWADADSRVHDASQDAAARDRLSWVWLPAGAASDAVEAAPAPQAELRAQRLQTLASERADRARYESRDLAAVGALPDWLARFYHDVERGHPAAGPEAAAELSADPAALRFASADAVAETTLEVRISGPVAPGTRASLQLRTPPGRWFDAAAPDLPPGPSARVPLRIAFRADHDSGAPPAGVTAEVRLGDRVYHRLIPASAQAVTDRLEVFVSADPAGAAPLEELRFRPVKGPQSRYLFVRNLSPRPRNLTVRLADSGGPIPGAEAKIAIREGETLPVRFAPPPTPAPMAAAPAAPSVPAAAPAPEAELPELKGPLEVRLLDADAGDAVVAVKTIPVGIASANETIQVVSVQFTPGDAKVGGAGNKLTVTVRAAPGLTGPPCRVELTLSGPDKPKLGTFQGEVAAGGELTLSAEDIPLGPGAAEDGFVFLSVDGRPRACVFRTSFPRTGAAVTARRETEAALRLRAPTAAPAGPHFEVGVEADDAPPQATLEVDLGRFQDGRFEVDENRRFPSPQNSRIGFRPAGADGGLTFEAAVSDWTVVFDARRIVGRREVRARLLDRDGAEVRTAFQPVALDDAGPEGVSFVDPPKRARKDAPLPLTVAARSPSGVARATFFLGRPTTDNKAPPNAATFPAKPTNPERTTWSAELPLKADKAGPIDVSVEVVNAAGLSSFATTTIELTDADPGASDPGRIEGSVLEGALPQPDLDVILRDDKGAEKGRVKTNAEGKFVFEKVPPGKYALGVEKSATMRFGAAAVAVEPGKTAPPVEIKLILR